MKIELKRISFNERMSEETNCFVADLYIDGKKVGECKNEGHGGPTDYYSYDSSTRDIIKKAEEYCKGLPKLVFSKAKGDPMDFEMDQSLESVIDDLLESYLKEKEKQKSAKKMEKEIRFGVPNGTTYRYITWKGRTLSQIPLPVLQAQVDKIRREYCKDGVVILNTNLAALGVV